MKDSKKKVQKSNSWIFLLLICLATCFMGVGFAKIDILLGITGNVEAESQDNIFITEVNYVSDIGADLNNSKILNSYQTILNSSIVLSKMDGNSSITYEIKVYNSTDSDYKFDKTDYMLGADTYDNENITFSLDGISKGDILKSKQNISFKITFYYRNNIISDNNQLRSFINFKFEPNVELVSAGTLINVRNISTGIFGSSLSKERIEKIHFVNYEDVPTEASSTWDASVEGNYSITGWATDEDRNGMYDVYLGADNGRITLPSDSTYIFAGYSSLTTIDFDNIDTSQVTNMSYMFSNSIALKSLDFSNFDTTNVTNMASMFYYVTGITELDLSSFNTSNVTNMTNMFYFAYGLTSLDLSSFDTSNVTNMNTMCYYLYKLQTLKLNSATFTHSPNSSNVFYYVSSSVYIIAKDDDARDWIQAKLGSGKGTIVTVAEL